MFWLGKRLDLELFGSLVDIVWHVEVAGAFIIVPMEVESTEDGSIPIYCYVIVFFEGIDEMLAVETADDFGAEIMDNETKKDRASEMLEEAWCVTSRYISISSQMFDEFLVGHAACLREAVHASSNFG